MSMESDLHSRVTGDGTISGLIGTRFYPEILPQNPTAPAATYQIISTTVMDHSHDGAGRLLRVRVQVDAYASTYLETITLSDAIRSSLDGFSGTMGSTTVPSCLMAAERAGWDFESALWRRSQDYLIVYVEAV